ncbi:hypothetical protein HDE_11030 [Halotydeus destructor]|nr:hypothetical protein HDE_11030 [Halotydeus destructor]
MKTTVAVILLGLMGSAWSISCGCDPDGIPCRHVEDANNACTDDSDCCGSAVCRPGPADISGECGLFCCYDSGSVATDSELCCNPCATQEICDCGIWACSPWGSNNFGGKGRGKK